MWWLGVSALVAGFAMLVAASGVWINRSNSHRGEGTWPCAQCGDADCALYDGGICFGCYYDNAHPDEVVFEGDVVDEVVDYLTDHT